MDLPVHRVDRGDHGDFRIDDPAGGPPLGRMTFRFDDGVMVIVHTETGEALRGTGAGRRLVQAAVDAARAGGFLIRPECPFAARTFDKTPEWADLRAP